LRGKGVFSSDETTFRIIAFEKFWKHLWVFQIPKKVNEVGEFTGLRGGEKSAGDSILRMLSRVNVGRLLQDIFPDANQ
tara:strand:- start:131 stop:364 length:234 start_codon:yes stop_codon:yes gene_type:complete